VSALEFQDVVCPIHGEEMGGPWSFAVEEGSFSGIITSPTTGEAIVRLCAGAMTPVSGTVRVLGRSPTQGSRFEQFRFRRRVGVCFQRHGLISNLSVRQNLLMPMIFAGGLSAQEADQRVSEIIQRLRLQRWAHVRPMSLPPEVRIMVGISRAAVHEPELLVLEDPATNLPPDMAEDLLAWCRERSGTMLVSPRTVAGPLANLVDTWIPLPE
jgi:cell division transport system ATP-binding protein